MSFILAFIFRFAWHFVSRFLESLVARESWIKCLIAYLMRKNARVCSAFLVLSSALSIPAFWMPIIKLNIYIILNIIFYINILIILRFSRGIYLQHVHATKMTGRVYHHGSWTFKKKINKYNNPHYTLLFWSIWIQTEYDVCIIVLW